METIDTGITNMAATLIMSISRTIMVLNFWDSFGKEGGGGGGGALLMCKATVYMHVAYLYLSDFQLQESGTF